MMTTMTCPEPPDRHTCPPDEIDEIDVDLDADVDLPVPAPDPSDTIPEGMEYLGSYPSISAYLRAMLEPEVTPACAWILDHLDYLAVQRRWESNGSRAGPCVPTH